MTMPNPLLVQFSDQACGGAAVAAHRLAVGLARQGARVERWFYAAQALADLEVSQVPLESGRKRPWSERLLRNVSPRLAAVLRRRRHERRLQAVVAQRRPALLHLHNLHGSGLCHASLLAVPPALPLVWTLHDCWPVRPWVYEWLEDNGQRCVLSEAPVGPRQGQAERARFFAARADTVLVGPSRWIGELARAAVPAAVRVEVIPNGVDVERFRPVAPAQARRALGLREDRILLGFAAAGFDRRKGGAVFAAALQQLRPEELEIVVWGDDSKESWPAGVTWRRFGFVAQETRLAQLYSACDLFVCPSRIDNLPNTIIESLACGTPVVASAVGGIPELVRPGQTGWLYGANQVPACAAALRAAVEERRSWPAYRECCRQVAVSEFSLEAQARACRRLYETLLSRR
jgi:glycosyltransferase involved in cell wall biosynthesis